MENALVGPRGLAAPGSRILQTDTVCLPLLSCHRENKDIVLWEG